MIKLLNGCLGRLLSFVATTSLLAFLSVGITSAEPALVPGMDVSIELIAPRQLAAGEAFTVYASVTNLGDQSVEYPAVLPASQAAEMDVSPFRFAPCNSACLSAGLIAPQQTSIIELGTYYYAETQLRPAGLTLDNFRFRYLNRDQLQTDFVDIPNTLSISITHDATADDIYAPLVEQERQPLQIQDLLADGDGLRLRDPNTGNDWVRFDALMDLGAQQLLEALAPGGQFEDYQLARISQVEELVVNHLRSTGLTVQTYDLYATGLNESRDELLEFARLVSSGHEGQDSSPFVEGAVADGKIYSFYIAPGIDTAIPPLGSFRLFIRSGNTSACACAESPPFSKSMLPGSVWDGRGYAGLWLVKSPSPIITRPENAASFFDKELVLPAVRIDGIVYRATLRLTDAALQVLRLGALEPASDEPGNVLQFDEERATLHVPEVRMIDSNGNQSSVRLTLGMVEHTNATRFQVLELEGVPSP
ncbi:MAG TPA: hypothetical protein DEG76_16210 [Pseudohongiella sp.]|nr:hypothetical protein [Pseudohongiella sp.]